MPGFPAPRDVLQTSVRGKEATDDDWEAENGSGSEEM